MATLLLVLFHIVAVGAVYISAYRTGFAVSESETRRQVEACAAPLTEMLERLNLDIDKILEDSPTRATDLPPFEDAQAAAGAGRRITGQRHKNTD